MNAAGILALLESDPAAGILATADLIEQRAKAATSGPWTVERGYYEGSPPHEQPRIWSGYPSPLSLILHSGSQKVENAEHIASWSPAPALAVAAWLRVMARIAHHAAERGYATNEQTAAAVAFCSAYLTGGAP